MAQTLPVKSVHISVLPSCIDCALCVLACPVDCLGFNQAERQLVVLSEAHCIVCLNCEDVCPTDAIRIGLDRYLPDARPVDETASNRYALGAPRASE